MHRTLKQAKWDRQPANRHRQQQAFVAFERYSGADHLSDLVGQKKLKRLESMRVFRYRRQDLERL